jgi:hypothetical protein
MHGRVSRISNVDEDEQVWYYPPITSEAGSRDWMLDSRERCVWRGKRNGGADSTWTERIEGCRSAEVLLQLVSGREERDGVSGSVLLCTRHRDPGLSYASPS